tara:strand:+ start:616 stop:1035 length:420 start_codon:yes stop_codon:yes gene_type:complete
MCVLPDERAIVPFSEGGSKEPKSVTKTLIFMGGTMKLITEEIEKKLSKNKGDGSDKPYLKLFNPTGRGTWLITSIEGDLMFGLCDLGMGFPELGYVSLMELQSLDLPFGLSIERDMQFEPEMSIEEYSDLARAEGRIVT